MIKKVTFCRNCKYFVGGGKINHGLGICMRTYVWGFYADSVHEKDFCSQANGKARDKQTMEQMKQYKKQIELMEERMRREPNE